ncbi:dTDP-4-amino-4,6-dideoxygalactose transaminase [Sulfurospirillum barnesii]|uniref:TDP-4-keto-6-deoxy-D-glucose transaminase n=1 Tax=Sulfurospirillum barnesii (strain ATCC 700032 / DSM 10660 / SES-3) TaxID=760154 RepID=I3XUM5_SULBS|nr:dTDP-4-amino-4,6-dideoxygalactose transaminase [Sulfurospirillum barnesii]AFL67649.1 TDP-4-keto-6-deoxy-D-glucose transaminase [Sulfurospirillum barnesii SES-3]
MIHFNKPPRTGNEDAYVLEAMNSLKISGDGAFGKACQAWFEKRYNCHKTLLTPSCTHALEMAALLLDIKEGDEVIMPSYTFVSTADAFALRGAKIVFVDVRPETMNMDERLIEAAITPKTRAIVPVHYAGVGCEMDVIMEIASRHNLFVVEDAAQGFEATYKGKPLGTIGHLGAFSFHETKNVTSGGEGGLLLINDEQFAHRAEIIREKGTNRSQFFRGMVDKYGWMDIGSSYLPSELQAAYLWGQLEKVDVIQNHRLEAWKAYKQRLEPLAKKGVIELAFIPDGCLHNAHMFYFKVKDLEERTALLGRFKEASIGAVFHYLPLHSAPAGLKYGRMFGEDSYTTKESERLVRLPLYYGISLEEIDAVCEILRQWSEC